MATLLKIKKLIVPLTSKNSEVFYNVIRNKTYTNYDFMPGPRPKNEKEMERAAKKYGLHPAEYKLYPDDGMHPIGDYPNLPKIGTALKDPYYPYDYPYDKRNYGEVIHADANIMGEDRCDFGEEEVFMSRRAQVITIFSIIIIYCALIYAAEPYPRFAPALEQQMPKVGVTHYTFEPAE